MVFSSVRVMCRDARSIRCRRDSDRQKRTHWARKSRGSEGFAWIDVETVPRFVFPSAFSASRFDESRLAVEHRRQARKQMQTGIHGCEFVWVRTSEGSKEERLRELQAGADAFLATF